MVSRGAGLVINPGGVLNQLEGGIIQVASWTLKEGVRLDAEGISSRDWDSYTVLRFSKAPEVLVELVNPQRRSPAPRRRRRKRRSDRRCIGNAVTHALGAHLRDLPLTHERVMAALLKARLELGAHLLRDDQRATRAPR
jgi:CO/xanthine dehydrogenase Mo-binding subunit